ncbi:C2 family cysteine protease [Actinomadura citrea]|uniref:C2 family cysteine protease n=1 Tax=Actinomadura citrea TaxID=46158 RepID=UPI002E27B8D3|nr:C2 family cysteine protease [Actinomadura citrea]
MDHPTRTDAKVEATDRPRPSEKPPGPPPDNPGAPGYPSRRESLARAREPVQQEGGTQQAAVKDSPARETEARDEPASPQAESGEGKDGSGPEAPDREEDAAKPEAETDGSEPGEDVDQDESSEDAKAEQTDAEPRDGEPQSERADKLTDAQTESAGEKAETHDAPVSSQRQNTLPTDNPGSPHQPSRRESHALAREPGQQDAGAPETESTDTGPTAEPASLPPEKGTTKTERPQEQGSSLGQEQKPGTDEPSPTSESRDGNAPVLGEGVARETATQPEKLSIAQSAAEPDTIKPEGSATPESQDGTRDGQASTTDQGPSDGDESLEGLDEGGLERGISERLKLFVGKLDRSDGPKELEGTVDRPDFQDPKKGPEGVPDRYGTPLEQSGGTRIPLFNGEPKREQTKQGSLGDCGIIATLGAVAAHYPEAIRACVREADDGNYQVRFHEAKYSISAKRFEPTGQQITLTVTPELPIKDQRPDKPAFARLTQDEAAWAPVLEKAIAGTDQTWSAKRQARVNEIWNARGNSGDAPTGYVRLNQGSGPGERAELLTQLTGLPAKSVPFPEGYDRQGRSADKRLRDDLIKQLSQGKPVLVGTRELGENESRLPRNLADGHAYELTEIDNKGRLHLRNPWNSRHPDPMTISEFKRAMIHRYSTLE